MEDKHILGHESAGEVASMTLTFYTSMSIAGILRYNYRSLPSISP